MLSKSLHDLGELHLGALALHQGKAKLNGLPLVSQQEVLAVQPLVEAFS